MLYLFKTKFFTIINLLIFFLKFKRKANKLLYFLKIIKYYF